MSGRGGLATVVIVGVAMAGAAGGMARADEAPALADVIAKVQPSVVYVTATGSDGTTRAGFATGIIVGDGAILTASYIANPAYGFTIYFDDGTSAAAHVAGVDTINEIAILTAKMPASATVAKIADADLIRRGDPVFGLGNYGTVEDMASTGIVAQTYAPIGSASYLATTAGVYTDNRGTPIFDMQGELAGLVVAHLDPGNGTPVALAVPADVISGEIDRLAKGDVTHGWLGISIRDASKDEVAKGGVFVAAVAAGGPADMAGLADGDIITAVNGIAVTHAAEVSQSVGGLAAGTKLSLDVLRGGWSKTVAVTLGDLSQARTPAQQPQTGDSAASPAAGGDGGDKAIDDFMREFGQTFGTSPGAPQAGK